MLSHWKLPLSILALLTLAIPGRAEGPPKIDKVRVGLPSGVGEGGRMRQGTWTPVYLHLKAHATGNGQKQFKIVLEALDLEENPYRYTVPVPALAGDVNEVVIGYLRSPSQDFTVTLQTLDGRTVSTPIKQQRSSDAEPLKQDNPLFLSLGGSSLPKLKAALLSPLEQGNLKKDEEIDLKELEAKLARSYARINKVADMPDRWFGYEAADVIILTTDNDEFMKDLTDSKAYSRRKALAEWVRRGGKLVVSVGRNHQLVNSLLSSMPLPEVDKMPLLPFEITGSVQRKSLPALNPWIKAGADILPLGAGKGGVELAKLARGPERPEKSDPLGDGTNVVLAEPPAPADNDSEQRPLVVRSSCGLGQVLLVAFDLDGPQFNDWKGSRAFWSRLADFMAPGLFDSKRLGKANFQGGDTPELYDELHRYIDTFEDVPVISFGWVALFIFLYILVVGPLDYLILKKVFKRLELTWVTFPTVVITISVVAYFIAYALKGDDLRVNKIDLVEIDLHTPQVYGTSWFTIFSPRMQNYTLGVEPMFKNSAAASLAAPKASTTMALLETPSATPRGSGSLFRPTYEYAEDASGIEHAPIPVWSTRSFVASWRTPYSPDKPPIRADLIISAGGIITGKIINEMPVDLQDVCLFYRDRWYKLPKNRTLAAKGDLFEVSELSRGDALQQDLIPQRRPGKSFIGHG